MINNYLYFIKKINFHFKNPTITYLYFIFLFLIISLIDVIGLGLIGPYVSMLVTDGDFLEKITLDYLNLSFKENKKYFIYLLSAILILIFIIKSILGILINYLIYKFSADTMLEIRSKLLTKYLHLPYEKYLKRNSSEYLNFMGVLSARCGEVIISFFKIISDLLIILFILIMLALTNIYAFLILAFFFILFIFFYDFFLKNKIFVFGKDASFFQQITFKNINELFGSFKENLVLNKKNYFSNYILKGFRKDAEIETKINTLRSMPKFLLESLIIILSVSFIVTVTFLGKNIEDFIIVISIFSVSIIRMVPLVSTITSAIGIIRFGTDGLEKVYNELNSTIDYIKSDKESDFQNFTFQSLKLSNISYKYNNKDKEILKNSNFSIFKNDKIGISSPSGTGKTTLIDLALGLLTLNKGNFLINDKNINNKLLEEFRNRVSYIPQQIYLMDASILTNITFKDKISIQEEKQLIKSLRKARLYEFINNLTDGINTKIGERGVRISGGQRQRIALARAFYFNKQIIFLDESTNQLDAETEKEVISDLINVSNDLTLILITHKKEILRLCNKVIYLKDGQVFEQ